MANSLRHDPVTGLFTTAVQLSGRNAQIAATIALGASLTGEIDLGDKSMLAIVMPDAWDTANLTFQAATAKTADGGVYKNVYDDSGFEVVVTAGTARIITIDTNALKLASLQFLKIRSGTSATPVNQTAARTLTIIGKN